MRIFVIPNPETVIKTNPEYIILIPNTKMPVDFDLEELRKEHNCLNYFETGLWDPRGDVSSKRRYLVGLRNYIVLKFEKIGFCWD